MACEDGQQVEAHKVILASSSPFFLNLLGRNKHPHSLIYIRGLNSKDLVAMIDFLYFGEANIYQENLDSFLAVAEEFQLKGLMGSGAEEEAKKTEPQPKEKTQKLSQKQKHLQETSTTFLSSLVDQHSSVAKVESSPPRERSVAVTDYTVATDLQDLDVNIKSMMEVSDNKNTGGTRGNTRICKVRGKEGRWSVIRSHIEANHITGVSHTCNICGTTTRSRHAMTMHKRSRHTAN